MWHIRETTHDSAKLGLVQGIIFSLQKGILVDVLSISTFNLIESHTSYWADGPTFRFNRSSFIFFKIDIILTSVYNPLHILFSMGLHVPPWVCRYLFPSFLSCCFSLLLSWLFSNFSLSFCSVCVCYFPLFFSSLPIFSTTSFLASSSPNPQVFFSACFCSYYWPVMQSFLLASYFGFFIFSLPGLAP